MNSVRVLKHYLELIIILKRSQVSQFVFKLIGTNTNNLDLLVY